MEIFTTFNLQFIMPYRAPTNHFPTKLHELLEEAEAKGHSNIISWCPDGKSFKIHDPQGMVSVIAEYFRQTKYKSLLRQLQGYNFKRVTSGQNKGNVSHPLFLRGRLELCTQMKRKQNSTKSPAKVSKSNDSTKTCKDTGTIAPKKAFKPKSTLQQKNVVTGNVANPVPPITRSKGTDIQKLESNYKHALSQPRTAHQMATVLSAPQIVGENTAHRYQRRPAGMEALKVEIGCTFSTPNKMSRPTKRMSSAPEFQSGRLSKRQRSYKGGPMNPLDDVSTSYKNASFPFSSIRGSEHLREDAILTEENMHVQKYQQEKQNNMQFEQLEKLCFSNIPQQFHRVHRSSSAMGTLDLDISLTTTTTTTHHNGRDPQVQRSMICNKFVLPSQLEPTPIISPKGGSRTRSTNICDGFTLSCDIDFCTKEFSSKVDNKNEKNIDILLKLQSEMLPQDEHLSECNSIGGDISLGRASEGSDEIDEGIAEAFVGDGNENKWDNVTFESDCEEDEEDWTKGITYEGKTDCVLEPEKFQIEVQSLLSDPKHERILRLQTQQALHGPNFVRQPQLMYQQHLNIKQLPRGMKFGQQPITALKQPQRQSFPNPFAFLSKPMPFHQTNFPSQIQIQQIKR